MQKCMVLKRQVAKLSNVSKFENDVEMYGAQTPNVPIWKRSVFENDVEMYGAQTLTLQSLLMILFENDVEMYGAQTDRTANCRG